jgi:hypothetical protein
VVTPNYSRTINFKVATSDSLEVPLNERVFPCTTSDGKLRYFVLRSHDCNNNIVRCHTGKKTGKSFKLRTKVAAKPFKAHEDFVLKDGTMVVNAGGLWCLNRESNNVPHGPRHKNSKLSTRNKHNKNRSDRKSGKAGRSERMSKCSYWLVTQQDEELELGKYLKDSNRISISDKFKTERNHIHDLGSLAIR